MNNPALLALEDGSLFHGFSVGAEGEACGEVVFNTAMSGYQEILTDPSYCRQIITFTCPHIGNTGVTEEDAEADTIYAAGLILRDVPVRHSNWRARGDLRSYLRERKLVALAGVDTRRLTRLLREMGAMRGCMLTGAGIDPQYAIAKARNVAGLAGMDLAREVSTREPYDWFEGSWQANAGAGNPYVHHDKANLPYRVVAYDFGVKHNILRLLADRGCRVTVVPAWTAASEVLSYRPDGIFLANGPGDPEPCDYAIAAIAELLNHDIPIFGICLGHQLLALAGGAKTLKMKVGHHGANHPVQDIVSKQVFITSQNHGFAVDESSLPETLRATHRSLFDGSLQGLEWREKPVFGFQGHPEASPGPHDILSLFDRFVNSMATADNT